MKAISKLEGAETKLLATAAKLNAKQAQSGGEQKGQCLITILPF